MNYYSFHIGDYRGATAHLSNEEDLCYRRLLDMYYDTQQPIPLETHWVARRLRVGLEVLEAVLRDFFVSKEDGWHNAKADKLVAEYVAHAEKNRANGKKGGRPPGNKTTQQNPVGFQSVPNGLPVETTWKGNQEPITNNQEPVLSPLTPRKRGKAAGAAGGDWFAELPPELDTPDFRRAWTNWISYRQSIKKPLNPASAPAAFRKALEVGIDAAIRGFDTAMANGWQGAFPVATATAQKNDHRAEKRNREFAEQLEVPDILSRGNRIARAGGQGAEGSGEGA
jgi:uncharacterized protein YdaU (DUF1376 family)